MARMSKSEIQRQRSEVARINATLADPKYQKKRRAEIAESKVAPELAAKMKLLGKEGEIKKEIAEISAAAPAMPAEGGGDPMASLMGSMPKGGGNSAAQDDYYKALAAGETKGQKLMDKQLAGGDKKGLTPAQASSTRAKASGIALDIRGPEDEKARLATAAALKKRKAGYYNQAFTF